MKQTKNCSFCNEAFTTHNDNKYCSVDCFNIYRLGNISGKKIGKWTVIKFTEYENNLAMWNCLCDCGTERKVKGYDLKFGHSKSCGCKMQETLNKKWGDSCLNRHYGKYREAANKRNIFFDLDKISFKEITTSNCHYCGTEPTLKKYFTSKNNFPINGIDRIDNSIGYIKENSVPCCKTCNFMKLKLGQQEFLDHITKIHNHSISKKENEIAA